jgi:hypothetical protein
MKTLLLCLSLLMVSCATIVDGTDQIVTIDSNVKDADVIFNGVNVGRTPFTGKVKKAKDPVIMVKKDGYEPTQQVLSTTVPTIFWGNIIIGGFFGSTTDYATGAMYEVAPKQYYINLKPNKPNASYDYDLDTKIKKFSMINFNNLKKDAARGSGEYLEGLNKLLTDNPSSKSIDLETVKKLIKASEDNSIKFGESVANYFFTKTNFNFSKEKY